MRRRALVLAVSLAAGAPAASAAQTARVAGSPERGGAVLGRVCLDADGDGVCGRDEPGVAGVTVRFDDGHRAVTDEEGRFHALDVAGRVVSGDRSAYGAHAVTADGLGVTRSFELAPGGVASVDLPVAMPADAGGAGRVGRAHAPTLSGVAVTWPIAGEAPPAAIVSAGGLSTIAAADGSWSLAVPLEEGRNVVGVAILREGGLALWGQVVDLARPSGGAIRLYPRPATLLAELSLRDAGLGTVVIGRATAGVAIHVGGRALRMDSAGRFATFSAASGAGVTVVAVAEGVRVEHLLPATRAEGFSGLVLGEAELQGGGSAGIVVSGRLAGSAAGSWRGFAIDAGLDLDDRDRSALAFTSPRLALASALVPDPRTGFAVAGDGADAGDANASRGRAWARVEGHGLRLGLGSGRTGLDGDGLGRYDRAFFGLRADGDATAGPVGLRGEVFGGRTGADALGLAPGVPRRDVFAATGGSLFYLRARNLSAGSEIVRVEWRDPWTGLTVAARELRRGADYELDAVAGRLLLARPLSTVSPPPSLASAEPFAAPEAWIQVDYLVAEAGDAARTLGGARGTVTGGPVALTLTGAAEESAGADWGVVAGRAALDLGEPLRVRVDVARSRGLVVGATGLGTSLDGGFTFAPPAVASGEATAVHATAEGRLGPARLSGWWRERPAGYSDGAFTEPVGARERGAAASGGLGPVALRLEWAERSGADPRDPTGATPLDTARALASGTATAGPVAVTLDALHERLRSPVSGSQSAAGVRADWHAAGPLTLEAAHMQGLERTGEAVDATFTSAGASVRTGDGTLGLRAGWGPELGPRLLLSGGWGDQRESVQGTLSVDPLGAGRLDGQGSAIGGRQRVPFGTLFTEERVVRDPLGLRVGRVAGASLEVAPGLALSASGERGERLRLDGSTAERGAGGVAASLARGAWRIDGRGELRAEGAGRQWVAGCGGQWEVGRALTLVARALLADGDLSGREARTGEAWLQGAWRAGPFSALARIARVEDHREGIIDRDATVGGVAFTGHAWRRVTAGIAVDAADQRVSGAADDRIAGSARVGVTVYGPLDVTAEYARRGSLDGRKLGDLQAVRAETGFTSGAVRLAVGYTLTGFTGSGIEPEGEDGRFYLRAVVAR